MNLKHFQSVLSTALCFGLGICFFAALASAQIPINATTPTVATPTYNIDQPARAPYQWLSTITCNAADCQHTLPEVPSGHRLIVEHVTGFVESSADLPQDTKILVVLGDTNGSAILSFMTAPFPGKGSEGSFDQPVRFYLGAGDQPTVHLRTYVSSFTQVYVSLIGYMVDCNAAPCAPIVRN